MASQNSRYILSLNSGSSSLKISLYSLPRTSQGRQGPRRQYTARASRVLTSSISNISTPPVQFTFELADSASSSTSNTDDSTDAITDHASAFRVLESNASIDHKNIVCICHRVVHGCDYTQPIITSKPSYNHIERLSDLAPLCAHFPLQLLSINLDSKYR